LALNLTEGAVLTAFAASVVAALAAAANVRWAANLLSCRFFDDPTRLAVSAASAAVGAIATDSAPQQNTVCMKIPTGIRVPPLVGGKKFGAVNEVDTTNDILVGAGLARWQAVRDACFAGFTDADGNVWTLYVLSREHSILDNLPQAVITAYAATSVILKKNVLTLRRRRSSQVI
jgi:hypothetical protein